MIFAPYVPLLSDLSREAHERNERSQHEPRVVRRGVAVSR